MKKEEIKPGRHFIGVGVGAMIFNSEGLVLIAKRGAEANNEAGKWEFPGGTVEYGEKCKETVVREIKEELDVEVEISDILDVDVVDHILPEEGQHWVSVSYIGRLVSGEPKIMEPHKCQGAEWANLAEIDVNILSTPSKSNYKSYIEKYGTNPPEFD